MPSLLAAFLDRFDRAYVFMRNPNHYFLKNMLRHIRETVFISTMPEEGVRGHISRFQLDQIRASEYDKNEMPVMPRDLFMDSGIDTAATGKKVIAIHPGSGGKKKCWPLDNFLKLAEMFQIRGNFLVKFICGPDEDEKIVAKIMTFINEKGSDAVLLRDRPLPEIASLLASATLYIGNDSGISHLTSLTGVPELILFGPTDHEVWRPLGQNVTVIRSDIHCSPCGQEVYQECPDAFCLSGLAPERVFETAINIIIPKTAEPYSNAVTSVQTVINRNN